MIVAIGMTLVIAAKGVDLSVGAVLAISGAVAAIMVSKGEPSFGAVLGASLGLALGLGLWNGFLVAYLGIQPIVATLVLMVSGRGIAQLLTDGQIVIFSNARLEGFASGTLLYVPFSLTLVAVAATTAAFLTRGTALGLFLEATGANERAARHSGIDTRTIRLFAYGFAGLCAGLAGLIVVAETRAADANNAGLYLELDAILAVVLGGTSLNGGRFTFVGSLLGALFIQALTTTILASGVSVEWTLVVKATAVFVVCLFQSPGFQSRALAWRGRT
jgi:simple sugar transport system permease protein